MAATRFAPLLCLLAVATDAAAAAPAGHFRILYAEAVDFDDGAARSGSGSDAASTGASARTKRTRFDAYGRRFDLALERKPEPLPEKSEAVAIPPVETTEAVAAIKH